MPTPIRAAVSWPSDAAQVRVPYTIQGGDSLDTIAPRFAQNTLDLAMTVEARPSSLVHKDFREFTAPMRNQRGSSIRLSAHQGDRLRRIGTIPDLGGNVP